MSPTRPGLAGSKTPSSMSLPCWMNNKLGRAAAAAMQKPTYSSTTPKYLDLKSASKRPNHDGSKLARDTSIVKTKVERNAVQKTTYSPTTSKYPDLKAASKRPNHDGPKPAREIPITNSKTERNSIQKTTYLATKPKYSDLKAASKRTSHDGPKPVTPVTKTKMSLGTVQKNTNYPSLRDSAQPSPGSFKKPSPTEERTKTMTPVAESRQAPTATRRSRRGDAANDFDEKIGHFRIELTDSKKIWCGKFALAISTREQLGPQYELTLAKFDEILFGEQGRAFNKARGWSDIINNFYDEQLDFVLRVWGQKQGLNLQLGVKKDYEGTYTCGEPPELEKLMKDEKHAKPKTVWIHNDNAMVCLGRPYNHYSGISGVKR